jgi:eukaryotic-like serine/threonine-protein kinase
MPLDPNRVQAVFGAAIECDAVADRAAVLDRECSTDPELRRRVEALLRAHDSSDDFLNQPLVGPPDPTLASSGEEPLDSSAPTGISVPLDLLSAMALSSPHEDRSGTGDDRTFFARLPPDLPAPRDRPIPAIDGYEILGELGRGGMGVVYRARQVRLNRPCVLKMILGGAHAGAEAVARFLAEAQAIARLQHPHIVQIHSIGETEGLPYFELEYVDGGSLDRRLNGTPWPARRAAELIEALARGVAEAHRLGIVHRDLKPGNVLLMADGTPKITDFGLAKSLAADSGLTRTDSIMGSPGYMAPEQAEGKTKHVGPLADVYALGAILYELLTGGPPFRGTTVLEILDQVKNAEPMPPSRLVPRLPRDVETIALKCMQKQSEKRYESAAALADDLRRFLGGEPIVARPVPAWDRAWRWCRRHPAPSALTAAVVLVAAIGLAGILWQWDEAVKARDLAAKRAVAEAEARRDEAKARQETETTLADMYTTAGISAGDQGEHARAALWFANAARRSKADPDRRLANAVRARTWGRRALIPLRAIVTEGSWPGGFVFHPTGRYLITTDVVDGRARVTSNSLWDLESERSLLFPGGLRAVPAAAWSPDGNALAAGLNDGDVVVARFPEHDQPARIPFPPGIRRLIFSADGRYLAIAGGKSARVWDIRSRTFATPELVHPAIVTTLAFHPEGRFLATGCLDEQGRLFAVPGDSGSPLWPPVTHLQAANGTAFYPEYSSPPLFVDDGRELITYGGKGGLTLRTVETGAEVRMMDSPGLSGRDTEEDRRNPVRFAATEVSPDGRYLAALGFQSPRVRLFEVATGRPVGPVLEHKDTVFSVTFSPDGRMLLTGSTDNTARLWTVPGGEPLARPLDLHRPVKAVAFAPHGRSLATQDGNLVRLWALPEEGVPMARVPVDGKDSFAALSPDGTLTIPTGLSFTPTLALRSTRASRVATGEPVGPVLRPGGRIVDAAFSPDGRLVATLGARYGPSTEGQEVVVWDWGSGLQRWRAGLPSEPRSLSYRLDGRRLAVLCGDGELLVFDPADSQETLRWRAHDTEPAHHWINNGEVVFSPDGRSVLTWGMGNDVRVWEAETGRLRYPPLRHRDKCHDLQFSPDGRLIALASYDGSVRVRDFATGTVVAELPAHPDIVYSAGFSPDGQLLVTACRDHTVRVWDWGACRLVCPPFEHAKDATSATFTPDGRWVLSASVDGTARAWDWRTGKPITPPLAIEGEPLSIAVTPDGKHAVVGGGLEALAVLDLGELGRTDADPDALCLRAELFAGQRLHEGGGTVNLSANEWLDRWRAFRRQSPAPEAAEPHGDFGAAPSGRSGALDTSAESREASGRDRTVP